MIPSHAIPPNLQDELFAAAATQLREEMGSVSIVKFLDARSETEAKQNWFDAIGRFLASMPSSAFVGARVVAGSPALEFSGGVVMTVRLFQLHDGSKLDDAWRLTLVPDLAAVMIDAIGWASWGDAWAAAARDLAGDATVLPVIAAGASSLGSWTEAILEATGAGDVSAPGARGWLVGGVPGPSAFLWFSNRRRAERAAVALAVGTEAMSGLFERLWSSRG